MSEFTAILTHGRKLQGAVKNLTIIELESAVEKLTNIIQLRKDKEAKRAQLEKIKQQKLADILKQIEEAGLDLADFQLEQGKTKIAKPNKKRAIKYSITDENGEKHQWTGIGRMPKVFANALNSGKSLDNFSV